MPLSANLKLSTNRPIVIHPHYEDLQLRERVKRIYSYLYGFRQVSDIHSLLKNDFKVKYLIIERHYCLVAPPGKSECSMINIVHLDLKKLGDKQACMLILGQGTGVVKYFQKVFEEKHISVFKVL